MSQSVDLNRNYITTSEAAKRSNLSSIYLAQLTRQGKLEGFRLGREWFIYSDSLEQFLATPRKPGPRGPRKPSAAKATSDTGEAIHQNQEG
jgi:excisionase family DNA binding protein